jgi:hypothetical protein
VVKFYDSKIHCDVAKFVKKKMSSNILYNSWNVKIVSISESINITQLAEIINLPDSRIYLPAINKYLTHYAWIDGFVNEEEANKFVRQWSNSSVFGQSIDFVVIAPKGNQTSIIHSSRECKLDSETKGKQDNSDPSKTSTSQMSTLTSSGTSNTTTNVVEKKEPLDHVHQSLNQPQYQRVITNPISQQVDKLGKRF